MRTPAAPGPAAASGGRGRAGGAARQRAAEIGAEVSAFLLGLAMSAALGFGQSRADDLVAAFDPRQNDPQTVFWYKANRYPQPIKRLLGQSRQG
jgi:hypothetical protein